MATSVCSVRLGVGRRACVYGRVRGWAGAGRRCWQRLTHHRGLAGDDGALAQVKQGQADLHKRLARGSLLQ